MTSNCYRVKPTLEKEPVRMKRTYPAISMKVSLIFSNKNHKFNVLLKKQRSYIYNYDSLGDLMEIS